MVVNCKNTGDIQPTESESFPIETPNQMNVWLTSRLSIMMFVQYFIWGAWATTLGNYMGTIDMAASIPTAYSFGPISTIIAPFFLGMVADRFFDSEKVLGGLCVLAGVAMMMMPGFSGRSKGR